MSAEPPLSARLRRLPPGMALLSILGAALLLMGGLAYLGFKALAGDDPLDFKFIWTAGRVWQSGGNAYGADFAAMVEATYAGGLRPERLYYPPHWWPIAVPLSLLPLDTAAVIWRVLTALALPASAALVWVAARPAAPAALPVALTGAFCLAIPPAFAIDLGQTSAVGCLAGALALYGLARRSDGAVIAGIFLATLKPSIGIYFVALLPLVRRPVLCTIALGAIGAAAMLPALLASGPIGTLSDWVGNVMLYGEAPENTASTATGLRHLLWRAGLGDISAMPLTLGTAALLALFTWWCWRRHAGPLARPETRLALGSLFVAGVLAVAPLHVYDFMLFAGLLFAAAYLTLSEVAFIAIAFLMLARAANVAPLIGLAPPGIGLAPGATLTSLAAVGLFIALAAMSFVRRRPGA